MRRDMGAAEVVRWDAGKMERERARAEEAVKFKLKKRLVWAGKLRNLGKRLMTVELETPVRLY